MAYRKGTFSHPFIGEFDNLFTETTPFTRPYLNKFHPMNLFKHNNNQPSPQRRWTEYTMSELEQHFEQQKIDQDLNLKQRREQVLCAKWEEEAKKLFRPLEVKTQTHRMDDDYTILINIPKNAELVKNIDIVGPTLIVTFEHMVNLPAQPEGCTCELSEEYYLPKWTRTWNFDSELDFDAMEAFIENGKLNIDFIAPKPYQRKTLPIHDKRVDTKVILQQQPENDELQKSIEDNENSMIKFDNETTDETYESQKNEGIKLQDRVATERENEEVNRVRKVDDNQEDNKNRT